MGLKHFFLILVVVLVTCADRSAFRKSLKISVSEDDDIPGTSLDILVQNEDIFPEQQTH